MARDGWKGRKESGREGGREGGKENDRGWGGREGEREGGRETDCNVSWRRGKRGIGITKALREGRKGGNRVSRATGMEGESNLQNTIEGVRESNGRVEERIERNYCKTLERLGGISFNLVGVMLSARDE